jgi:integrase
MTAALAIPEPAAVAVVKPKGKRKRRSNRAKGEGTISRQGHRWFASVTLKELDPRTGRRRRVRRYFASQAEAVDGLKSLRDEFEKGGLVTPKKMSVGELFDEWAAAKTGGGEWELTTGEFYTQRVEKYLRPALGKLPLAELTTLHVDRLKKRLSDDRIRKAQLRHCLVTLKAAINFAVSRRLIPLGKVAVYMPKRDKPKPKPLTRDDLSAFRSAAASDRLTALYDLALDTGARLGELLGLDWRRIDLDAGTVTIDRALAEVKGKPYLKSPKNEDSVRVVPLAPSTVEALRQHRRAMLAEGHCRPDSPVFPGERKGEFMAKGTFYRASFGKVCKAAKLKFHFHQLRHSSASHLLNAGLDIRAISERLGHGDVGTTMRIYAGTLDKGRRAVGLMSGILADTAPKTATAGV